MTNGKNFTMTNSGLSICLPVVQTLSYYLAILNAHGHEHPSADDGFYGPTQDFHMAIPIRGRLEDNLMIVYDLKKLKPPGIMERMSFPQEPCYVQPMWSLCQPEMFIRSRPGPLVCGARDMKKLSRPFQYGFLLILDNIRALDRRKEGAIFGGEADAVQNKYLLRLKPTPTDSIFLTERIGCSRSIETYPPGLLDPLRGLVFLEPSNMIAGVLITGVLVRIGLTENKGCVLFLGIKMTPCYSRPFRFCKVLPPSDWSERPESLSRLLQIQKNNMRGRLISHAEDRSEGYSVVINEGQETRLGSIFLTYVHHVSIDTETDVGFRSTGSTM